MIIRHQFERVSGTDPDNMQVQGGTIENTLNEHFRAWFGYRITFMQFDACQEDFDALEYAKNISKYLR